MIHLDTNACIRALNRSSEALVAQLEAHDPSEIAVSSVVRAELAYGARRSRHVQRNLEVLERFFAPVHTVAFDELCAGHYGRIRAELESQGTVIGPNDLLIAATALAHDALLITADTREFSRVASLRIEDWENP